jgi:hypothetical protein
MWVEKKRIKTVLQKSNEVFQSEDNEEQYAM